MLQSIVKNWTTSVPGFLALLCASTDLLGLIPDPYHKYALATCGFLVGVGLIAAKSANVTNSKDPGPAQTVPPAA